MPKVLHVVTSKYEYIGELVRSEKEHYLGPHWIRLDSVCRVIYTNKANGVSITIIKINGDGNYRPYVDINMTTTLNVMGLDDKGELYQKYRSIVSGLIVPNFGVRGN